MAIAEIGNRPEGFRGEGLARGLNRRFGTPVNMAVGALLIAEYLYHRVADSGLSSTDAISQLSSIASEMDEPVEINDKLKDGIAEVLSFKPDYEVALADVKATANAPHFIGINGSWGVKSVKMSNGEIIRVPVVTLSITWHDGAGNNQEAFLQMSDRNWQSLTTSIETISSSREDIDDLLRRPGD